MHFSNLDAYFHMASHGCPEAYELLYNEFLSRAETTVRLAGFQISKYTEISIDFQDFVDYLFFKILNEYDRDRGPFGRYCDYCLNQRLIPRVMQLIKRWRDGATDSDVNDCEYIAAENSLFDHSSSEMHLEIERSELKLVMSSPNASLKSVDKTTRNVILMLYLGYKPVEIKRGLQISEWKYRSIIQSLQKDENMLNLKLEMK